MFGSIFKKRYSADAIVEAILSGLTKGDLMQVLRVWESDLSGLSGQQIQRVKEEMFYLDFFAAYIVLKFNDSPGWKQNGMHICEKVHYACAIFVATTFANKANATTEEVKKGAEEIRKRLEIYGPIFEKSEDVFGALGLAFSKLCQIEGKPVLIRIGSDWFNARGQMLTKFAQEHSVSD